MKRPTTPLRPEEVVAWILTLDEGQYFEFKRAGNNSRALESVVAFANASGEPSSSELRIDCWESKRILRR